MSVASIYARQDGTIAHITDGIFAITPDANTAIVIQFAIDSYPVEYQHIAANSKAALWDGANLQIDSAVYLSSAWIAARQAELAQSNAKAIARTLMLSTAKNYLSEQLQAASPNVANIHTTIRAYVADNAILTQMVTNQIAVAQTAFGWSLNLTTPTATDRMRYIVCIQLVLATIA